MQPLAIVPAFDVRKNGRPCSRLAFELSGCTFSFQRGEKTFSNGIVIAVTRAAHAHRALQGGHVCLVSITGVLAAPVRVMEQALPGLAIEEGHLPGIFHQINIHLVCHGPAHHQP